MKSIFWILIAIIPLVVVSLSILILKFTFFLFFQNSDFQFILVRMISYTLISYLFYSWQTPKHNNERFFLGFVLILYNLVLIEIILRTEIFKYILTFQIYYGLSLIYLGYYLFLKTDRIEE